MDFTNDKPKEINSVQNTDVNTINIEAHLIYQDSMTYLQEEIKSDILKRGIMSHIMKQFERPADSY